MTDHKKVLFVGQSGAGKDTACLYLASITNLRFAGTTSFFLARHVAARLGIPLEQALRGRHANRNLFHRVGNEIRRQDPGLLIRESLEHAEITGGVRGAEEIRACRQGRLVDLIVWVANDRVRRSSTVRFDERDCDVVVDNHGAIEEFHRNLLRLAHSADLPLREGGD